MKKLLLSLICLLAAPMASAFIFSLDITSAPSSAYCSTSVYLEAQAMMDCDGSITLTLDGQYVASSCGYDMFGCGGNATVASSPCTQWVEASANDLYGNDSSTSASIAVQTAPLLPMETPTSSNATIDVGTSWTPTISVPSSNGSGAVIFCVANYTDWGTASWTPTEGGTYSFYVGQMADVNHYGNVLNGSMMVNPTPYTLTVNKISQSGVSISPSEGSINTGQSVTFTASGGSGSGSYIWGGAASGSGSSNTVTFNSSGSCSVTVYRQGDGAYVDSNTATATIVVSDYTYSLTVENGSGGGSYTAGTSVSIAADSPSEGYAFSNWTITSGSGTIADAYASSTTFTMAAGNATVTANYQAVGYTLTVQNGSGGGSYNAGSTVSITADSPPGGYTFSGWTITSGSGSIANAYASSTTFTTAACDATVAANYQIIPPTYYTLTVQSGTGGGSYTAGTSVSITANAPPSGYAFSYWSVSGSGTIANTYASTTTFTMGSGAATLTANYQALPPIDLIIHRP